jgi:hypothetical protein
MMKCYENSKMTLFFWLIWMYRVLFTRYRWFNMEVLIFVYTERETVCIWSDVLGILKINRWVKEIRPSQGKWPMLYILPWQFECIINPSPSLMKFNITWSPSVFVIFYLPLSVNFTSTFSINTYRVNRLESAIT